MVRPGARGLGGGGGLLHRGGNGFSLGRAAHPPAALEGSFVACPPTQLVITKVDLSSLKMKVALLGVVRRIKPFLLREAQEAESLERGSAVQEVSEAFRSRGGFQAGSLEEPSPGKKALPVRMDEHRVV